MNTSDQAPTTASSLKSKTKALAKRGGRTPFESKLIQAGHATSDQFDRAVRDSQEQNVPFINVLEQILGQQLAPDIMRSCTETALFLQLIDWRITTEEKIILAFS